MERDPTIKRDEILMFAAVWLNLENPVPSERGQSQETIYCMTPFIWMPKWAYS